MSVAFTKPSVSIFRFSIGGSIGDSCDLLLEIINGDLLSRNRRNFLDEIERQGYGLEAELGDGDPGPDASMRVLLSVADIWQPSAADQAARLTNRLLDVAGVDRETRLNLSVRGKKSLNGLREARERQKKGDDQAFPWHFEGLELEEPELQRRVREKLASWLLPK